MSMLFDDLARVAASPLPRRQVVGMLLGTVTAVLLGARRAQAVPAIVCDEPLYPHECATICCRKDYPCRSKTLLNGADEPGVCCFEGFTLCSDGTYGWCCDPSGDFPVCGTERWQCTCAAGAEECGSGCCGPDEFCCDPVTATCCAKDGGVCCYDWFERGSCCASDEKCVPAPAIIGTLDGRVCCPEPRAAKGQCCPEGYISVLGNPVEGYLYCCPAARATLDRDGCCGPGYVYVAATDSCCVETAFCNGDCCATGRCANGKCEPCPEGLKACSGTCCAQDDCCFGTCCPNNTCCLGKCCPAGTTCTGECTKIETVRATIDSAGGVIRSTDQQNPASAGIDATAWPAFQAYIPSNVLTGATKFTYTSREAPSTPLPTDAALLRSFTFTGQGLTQTPAGYSLYLSFTPVTLGALGVASEEDVDLLYRAGNQWTSLLDNCTTCSVNALPAVVTLQQTNRLGEFALVARPTANPPGQNPVYLPFIGS